MSRSYPASHPNLVYVFADELRYDACAFAGGAKAHTPNMDTLASEGVSFSNAVSGHPLCAPHRACLFTGKYSSSTGMVVSELRMNPNHVCLGHVLQQGGYETAYIGKWHLWGASPEHYGKEVDQCIPPGPHRLGFDGYWAAYNAWHEYYHAFYYSDGCQRVAVEGYEPDAQTDLAIRWIREGRDPEKPFALFLSFGVPHDPWCWDNVPAEYAAMFRGVEFPLPVSYTDGSAEYWDPAMTAAWWLETVKPNLTQWQQIYYAMVANLDWNVGRLLGALDQSGLRDQTIVVFTSDHGELFGAHGRIAKNIFYDEACHVPFLARWPGHLPAGYVTDACLNTPDIMPTILSMLGLAIPDGVEGQDLSHCAAAQPGPEPEAAFMQGMGHTYRWEDGYEWRALRDKRYTYAVMRVDRSEYLFDNQSDPDQMRNLAQLPAHSGTVRRFRTLLEERMRALGDTFEACTWYRDRWIEGQRIAVVPGAARSP